MDVSAAPTQPRHHTQFAANDRLECGVKLA